MTTSPDAEIEVTVIGGYLGAGKTTLVNHILRNADERIAVIVNDFGDINIDAELVESDDGDTLSLANGCICCSMVDGFIGALAQIRALDSPPQRLVIEASGVANPSQITAYAHGPGLELDGTIVVVDAERIARQLRDEYIRDVVRQQLAGADLIVLNKADLATDVEQVRSAIAAETAAPTVPACSGNVPLDVLLGLGGVVASEFDEHQHADDRFRTWVETYDEPIDADDLRRTLSSLPASIVRVKGLVRLAHSPDLTSIVQVVGSRVTITEGGRWSTGSSQLVFIEVRSTPFRSVPNE